MQRFLKSRMDPNFPLRRIDGAVDLVLEKLGYVTLVCARRWQVARTGVEPLRELVAASEKCEARGCQYAVAGVELARLVRVYSQ